MQNAGDCLTDVGFRPNGSRQLDLPLLTRLVRVEGIVLGSISTDPLAGIGVRDW
jgi:hypothetical protein